MWHKVRSALPSHTVAIAYLALFVALGGSAYATTQITGKNVKDGSLTGKDLKDESVTGKEVKNLTKGDFVSGTLLAGAQGPVGPPGPSGPPGGIGPKGDTGPAAATCATPGVLTLTTNDPPKKFCQHGVFALYASCILSGGGSSQITTANVSITSSSTAGMGADSFYVGTDGTPAHRSHFFGAAAGQKPILEFASNDDVYPKAYAGITGFYAGDAGGDQLAGNVGARVWDKPNVGRCEFVVVGGS